MDIDAQSLVAQQAVEALEEIVHRHPVPAQEHARVDREVFQARRAIRAYKLELRGLSQTDDETKHQACERSVRGGRPLRGQLSNHSKNHQCAQDLEHRVQLCKWELDRERRQATINLQVSDLNHVQQADQGRMTLEQVANAASRVQDASMISLQRTKKMVLESERSGISTLNQMHEQEEQLKRVESDTKAAKSNVDKSRKLVRKLAIGALNIPAMFSGGSDGKRSWERRAKRTKTCPATDPGSSSRMQESKKEMSKLLEEIRNDILMQISAQKSCNGECVEASNASQRIEIKFDELERQLLHIRQLHKQIRDEQPNRRSQVEHQEGYQIIRDLRLHIDEARQTFLNNQCLTAKLRNASRNSESASAAAQEVPTSENRRAPTEEERSALASMRQQDMKLDSCAAEVGQAVERLGELASQIGVSANRQNAHAHTILEDVDAANQDVKAVSRRVGRMLR
jgi:hypothetical protein